MTIIEQIKAEIERRKKSLRAGICNEEVFTRRQRTEMLVASEELDRLNRFLSTLESERPMDQEGLEEELDKWRHIHFNGERDGHFSGEYLERTSQLDLARHFYDLGCRCTAEKYDEIEYNRQRAEESVPNDIEEAAEEYLQKVKAGFLRTLEHPTAKDCFKDGAKWDREQMMTVAGAIVIAGVLISFSIDRLADAIKDKEDSHE